MISQKNNLLVTLADSSYVKQAKAFFSSVYYNSGWQGDYMLLAHNISQSELQWFKDKGILVKDCELLMADVPGRWSAVILSKLYLFRSEFKKWDSIIYLDADSIVEASLDDLTKVNTLGTLNIGYPLLKFKITNYFDYASKYFDKELFSEIKSKYDLNAASFSGSILAINTRIIKDDTFSKLLDLMPVVKFSRYPSEISLNLLFINQWQKISKVYNLNPIVTKNYCNVDFGRVRAIVLHFLGQDNKPWFENSPFYQEWKDNLDNADQMDLNNRLPAKKKWTKREILFYPIYLHLRFIIYFFVRSTDYVIGLTGKKIKKINPELYYLLKKFLGG